MALAHASMDAVVCTDADGRILLWNGAARAVFGYSDRQARDLFLPLLFHEGDRDACRDAMRRVLAARRAPAKHELSLRGLRQDGGIFPCMLVLSAGRVDGAWIVTAVLRDQSWTGAAEIKYRRLFETSPDAIMLMDEHGFIDANSAALDMFGCTSLEAFVGRHPVDFSPQTQPGGGDSRLLADEHIATAIAQGSHRFDWTHRRTDGSEFPAAVWLSAMDIEGRRVLQAVVRDISVQKMAETRLKRSLDEAQEASRAMLYMLEDMNDTHARVLQAKKEWEATFDAVTDPVFLHDADGRIVRANRAYAEAARRPLEEINGLPYWEVFPERDGPLSGCLHGHASEEEEEEFQAADGRVYLSHSYAIRDAQGVHTHSIHFCQDITERRQAALRLRRSLEGTIHAIATAVEARDPYTAGHQSRVAELAAAIATEMDMDAGRIEGIRWGGMIHDIGKIHLPAEILAKPTRLTAVEYDLIKEHAEVGFSILKGVEFPWPVADIAHQHHERLDGSGYPQGLKDEEICLEARILAVADVTEAMASHRPYRAGLGIDAALAEISRGRGAQYDADAVDACCRLFRTGKFSL